MCPGVDGELRILPHHAPLLTTLGVGELRIKRHGEVEYFAIAGGFLQVRPDKVVVMAETADMASEIDLERAMEPDERPRSSCRRASKSRLTWPARRAALQRALLRVRVAERHRREGPRSRG